MKIEEKVRGMGKNAKKSDSINKGKQKTAAWGWTREKMNIVDSRIP